MNLLDRLINYVSPEAGARRKLARMVLAQSAKLTGYRESQPTIRDPNVYARGSAADLTLEQGFDRREIVDRSRQLERDNALACTLLDRSGEHVVGAGFKLKCKTKDKEWNKAAEEYFEEWSKKADSRGILSFNEILNIVFRSWLRDGDVGTVLESDGTLRIVESDEIASKVGGYTRPSDADGIEMDRRGRIVSYSVFDYDQSVLWPDRRKAIPRLVKVPAKDMIFLARRQRAGQTRGISAFAGITWLLESLDNTLEAVVVAHHMAACFGLVVHKKNAFNGYSQSPDDRGVLMPEISLGPGKIMRLDPGEEAMQINPSHPGQMFEVLCDSLMRIAGSRFSTPLEILNYNFTKSNYSNMRAASLECAMAAKIKQTVLLQKHFCTPVWGWVLANAIRTKALPPNKEMHKHVWGVPESPWVDLVAELQVAMGSVDGALDTRRNLCAKRGLDWDEVIEELAEEDKKLEAAGIEAARGNLTRDAVPTTMAKVDPDAPKPEKKEKKEKKEKAHDALNNHGNDYNRLRDIIDFKTTRIEDLLKQPVTPPTAPPSPPDVTVNNYLTSPQGDTIIKNEFTPPDVLVEVKNEIQPPKVEIANTTNVDVNAKIQGTAKTITVRQDEDGDVLSIDVKPEDDHG